MKHTVAELFAGIGGFRCGFNEVKLEDNKTIEKENWQFVYANQYEPRTKSQPAWQVYTTRFGNKKEYSNKDIYKVDKNKIPDHTVLTAGFPCQDYSVARVNAEGIKGKEGVLWWQIIEVIDAKKPPFILLENVDRLIKSPAKQRGRDYTIILYTLHRRGYDVQWRVINAADYGYPQKRRRIYIVAYHRRTNYYQQMHLQDPNDIIYHKGIFARQFPVKDDNTNHVNCHDLKEYDDILQVSQQALFHYNNTGLMQDGLIITTNTTPNYKGKQTTIANILEQNTPPTYNITPQQHKRLQYHKGAKHQQRKHKNGTTYYYTEGKIPYPDPINKPSRTILTTEHQTNRTTHIIKDPHTSQLRTLTPLECERLQTIPDNWTNTPNTTTPQRYKLLGNTLITTIITKISHELYNIIQNE